MMMILNSLFKMQATVLWWLICDTLCFRNGTSLSNLSLTKCEVSLLLLMYIEGGVWSTGHTVRWSSLHWQLQTKISRYQAAGRHCKTSDHISSLFCLLSVCLLRGNVGVQSRKAVVLRIYSGIEPNPEPHSNRPAPLSICDCQPPTSWSCHIQDATPSTIEHSVSLQLMYGTICHLSSTLRLWTPSRTISRHISSSSRTAADVLF